jgi:hypothetical protein
LDGIERGAIGEAQRENRLGFLMELSESRIFSEARADRKRPEGSPVRNLHF